jgi:hypothetical protein
MEHGPVLHRAGAYDTPPHGRCRFRRRWPRCGRTSGISRRLLGNEPVQAPHRVSRRGTGFPGRPRARFAADAAGLVLRGARGGGDVVRMGRRDPASPALLVDPPDDEVVPRTGDDVLGGRARGRRPGGPRCAGPVRSPCRARRRTASGVEGARWRRARLDPPLVLGGGSPAGVRRLLGRSPVRSRARREAAAAAAMPDFARLVRPCSRSSGRPVSALARSLHAGGSSARGLPASRGDRGLGPVGAWTGLPTRSSRRSG